MTKSQKILEKKHGTPLIFLKALSTAAQQGVITIPEMMEAFEKYQTEWDQTDKASTQTPNQSDHQLRVEQLMIRSKQTVPNTPTTPDESVRILRAKLILEEALEAVEALGIIVNTDYIHIRRDNLGFTAIPGAQLDLSEIAKECCDISVVTIGTLSACGIKDLIPQQLVDENNLGKFGPGHSYRPDGKLVKPPNYPKPDIKNEINRQKDNANQTENTLNLKTLTDAIQELKPLLNGDSGCYLGEYEHPAKKIASLMGWQHIWDEKFHP